MTTDTKREFEENVERSVGLTMEQIRATPLSELRMMAEKKLGRRLSLRSYWPFIGRGNVMRDLTTSSDSINSELDRILG